MQCIHQTFAAMCANIHVRSKCSIHSFEQAFPEGCEFFYVLGCFFNSFSPYLPFLKEQRQGEKTCFHKLHLKYDSRAIVIVSDMQFRTIFGYYRDHMHSFIFVFIFCSRFRFFQPLICNKNKGYTVRTFLISTL